MLLFRNRKKLAGKKNENTLGFHKSSIASKRRALSAASVLTCMRSRLHTLYDSAGALTQSRSI
jgi:hypothetical protein